MTTLRLREQGILPNTDVTLSLYQLFLQHPSDTEFVFEEGDYYFSPHEEMRFDYRISNSDSMPYRVLGIWMRNMKNCVLRGNGARLWFEGHMQCFTLDHCDRVTLSGFKINWKKPLVAEGVVRSRDEEHLEVFIDPEKFPHRFRDGVLEFDVGAGEWYAFLNRTIAFEPHGRAVRRGSADVVFDEVRQIGENLFSMKLKRPKNVQVGDLLNLRHNRRIHACIFSERCRDLLVEDVTVYSCGGLGCLAQFCHNLTYRRVHYLTDTAAGRLVSGGRDDGMNLTGNSGTIHITECTFHGLMDDPINVHGCCVTCDEVVDDRTLRCRYRHPQACGFYYWAEAGDTVSFIARDTMSGMGRATVSSYQLEDRDSFLLALDQPLSDCVLEAARKGNALAVDNLSHTADLICTKNRFGSGRARGMLVSTPGRVRIAHNYFESSGASILMSGDSNYWFESGECHDVEITGNVFTDGCLSSQYQFDYGVISISPVIPEPRRELPFHKNIRITDNVFDCPDTPVLYAFSCDGLVFSGNRVFKSPSAERVLEGNERIRLRYCKNVAVEKNQWIGCFGTDGEISLEECEGVQSDMIES